MKYLTKLFSGWDYLQVGSAPPPSLHLISSPLRRKTKPGAARLHTDVSSGLICCGRKKRFPSESWEILECWRACGGAAWMRDRPSSPSHPADFSVLSPIKLSLHLPVRKVNLTVDCCTCWFAELLRDRRSLDLWKKKSAVDCLWKIQLTRHMMVFSLLHIGILEVKEHAWKKYPHTLPAWTTEQISHLKTLSFCLRLFKIFTSILYDCKHWTKKVLFLALKHTRASHSVFIFH